MASKSVKMVIRNEQVVAQGCQLGPVHGPTNRHLLVTLVCLAKEAFDVI